MKRKRIIIKKDMRNSIGKMVPVIGIKKCLLCNKEFEFYDSRTRFCSQECLNETIEKNSDYNKRDTSKLINDITNEKPIEIIKNLNNVDTILIYDYLRPDRSQQNLNRGSSLNKLEKSQRFFCVGWSDFFRLFYPHKLLHNEGERVLDIGCGYSDQREMFWRHNLHVDYVGIDLSFPTLMNAMKRKSRNPSIYLQVDLKRKRLPVKDKCFDLIIFTESIEHIPRKDGINLVKEAHRILKDDGKMFFGTPDSRYTHGIYDKEHMYEYSYPEIKKILSLQGFNIVEMFGNGINAKELKEIMNDDIKKFKKIITRFFPADFSQFLLGYLYPERAYLKTYLVEKK